jgi:hypothetical protein
MCPHGRGWVHDENDVVWRADAVDVARLHA